MVNFLKNNFLPKTLKDTRRIYSNHLNLLGLNYIFILNILGFMDFDSRVYSYNLDMLICIDFIIIFILLFYFLLYLWGVPFFGFYYLNNILGIIAVYFIIFMFFLLFISEVFLVLLKLYTYNSFTVGYWQTVFIYLFVYLYYLLYHSFYRVFLTKMFFYKVY